MAEAAAAPPPDAGGEAEKGNAKEKGEEESRAKLCFFACLDCMAAAVRACVAAWNGFKWLAKRVSYPIKEAVLSCVDSWKRWCPGVTASCDNEAAFWREACVH